MILITFLSFIHWENIYSTKSIKYIIMNLNEDWLVIPYIGKQAKGIYFESPKNVTIPNNNQIPKKEINQIPIRFVQIK